MSANRPGGATATCSSSASNSDVGAVMAGVSGSSDSARMFMWVGYRRPHLRGKHGCRPGIIGKPGTPTPAELDRGLWRPAPTSRCGVTNATGMLTVMELWGRALRGAVMRLRLTSAVLLAVLIGA